MRMEIICDSCQKKLNISDNKIPKDRVAYLNCPGCKNRIAVNLNPRPAEEQKNEPPVSIFNELITDIYDAAEKPFDFLVEEAKKSLVCVPDQNLQEKINPVLIELEYHNTVAENARDALKKMRYHTFDLVILDELFDCKNFHSNGVLIYLQHLPMTLRRNIFSILLTTRFRTMDNMEALHKSVSMIINKANINEFKKILLRGVAENEIFYKMYKNTAKKILGN
jgi:hypothetical protein